LSAPDGIDRLILQEFRLTDGASHAEADGILASAYPDGVPLLMSISDDRDVASVRSIPYGTSTKDDPVDRASFGALVSSWQSQQTYRSHIVESSLELPTRYRMAVTESGLNDSDRALPGALRPADVSESEADMPTSVALLWIGAPVGTHAGLLVLVGNDDEAGIEQDAEWPLPLSQQLGVRIYDSCARA